MSGRDESDAEGYSAFYRRAYGPLVGQVFVVSADREIAKDAVQEAFVRLWRRWRRVSRYEKPEAWVRRVAINLAIDRRRRERHAGVQLKQAEMAPPAVEGAGVSPDGRLDLVAALRWLSPTHREALLLHYVVGLTAREIAAEMSKDGRHVREATVRSWLARGREALAKRMSVGGGGNG